MIALLLAALVQGAPVALPAAPATPPAKAVKADKPRTVCRKETVVGSSIKKKICPRKVEDQKDAEEAEKTE